MRVFLLVSIVICGLASPTIAGWLDGNELHGNCEVEAPFDQGICLGYIAGAASMLVDLQTAGVVRPLTSPICVPQAEVQAGQITDVVKKYLREHPENRHFGGAVLVIMALREAFPCK